ncbi:MAG: hypothetical protein KXJ53_15390 [Phenylobacterium sp.]|jgi:hypothetical protein|nr:hypothetical protein [Phenylobacterium sp.]
MNLAHAVAAALAQNPWAKEMTLDTSDKSPSETLDLAKEIIEACDAQDIQLKGVRVDPFIARAFPAQPDIPNAVVHQGAVVVLDPRLIDRIEVVRR